MFVQDELVTVAVFSGELDFLLARTRLESAGIECFSQGEHSFRMGGWHANGSSGVVLQVRESEAADALHILRQAAPLDATGGGRIIE